MEDSNREEKVYESGFQNYVVEQWRLVGKRLFGFVFGCEADFSALKRVFKRIIRGYSRQLKSCFLKRYSRFIVWTRA